MEENYIYTMKHPVTVGEYVCNKLEFTRPKTKDFIAIGASPIDTAEAMVKFISANTGVSATVINQFDIDDISRLRIVVGRVFNSYLLAKDFELNPTKEAGEDETVSN